MAGVALSAIGISVALMVVIGALGPSAAEAGFPPAPPWPPWFIHTHISLVLAVIMTWTVVVIGSTGLVFGLIAARRGWRPPLRRLICGSVLAVVALTVTPPTGSADMLLYAAYGRIAVLGHSPYTYLPGQLKSSGDPVGTVTGLGYLNEPSRYGPIAIATEEAASRLAGDSTARTIFWLKVWNGLAYLALVLALDRLLREDESRRVRVHLLWSLNPLMLWAVMAGGHVDGLAIGVGAAALFAMPRVDSRRALFAGVLLGLASAIKAPFALFGGGLAWAARRSPLALAALGMGAAVVTIPIYLLAGRASITAVVGVAKGNQVDYVPWYAVARALHWHDPTARIDALGLIGFVLLGLILLRRMPSGPSDFPAVRVALALVLAWLIVSPQQRPWYDVMIFPLIALMPATRLDWIVLIRGAAGALGDLPTLVYRPGAHPAWLSEAGRTVSLGTAPLTLTAVGIVLLWLCLTNDWRVVADPGSDLVEAMPLRLPPNLDG
jgi:alpha-1,6-mannosyltransferase